MESMATPETAPDATPAEAVVTTPAVAPINTHLVMSIVSFVIGGGLFGLLAIIFSVMAKNALQAGNATEAETKAKWAKVLAIVGIVAAVLWWAGIIMLMASGVLDVEGSGSVTAG
jgi:archaellum biogenesis protein FlaJ (TadC family)